MRLLLDLRCLTQPKTGVQIVAANLLTELLESALGEQMLLLTGENGPSDARVDETRVLRSRVAPYDFRRQGEVAAMINASSADVVLSPTYFMPFGVRKPYIITVHDLIPRKVWLGAPSLYVWGLLGQRMRQALDVWTVSDYSRRDILRHHPALKDRLQIIPSGYVTEPSSVAPQKEDRSLLLFSSKFRHKNVAFAMAAFTALQAQSGNQWRLHVVGHPDTIDSGTLPPGVEMHGRVSDDQLTDLYRRSWGLLLPSIEEGFSLPLLEGMSHGCLVFFHRKTAMQETAGDGGIGLDLDRPQSWAGTIAQAHGDPAYVTLQRARALERATLFSRERFSSAVREALVRSLAPCCDVKDVIGMVRCP